MNPKPQNSVHVKIEWVLIRMYSINALIMLHQYIHKQYILERMCCTHTLEGKCVMAISPHMYMDNHHTMSSKCVYARNVVPCVHMYSNCLQSP